MSLFSKVLYHYYVIFVYFQRWQRRFFRLYDDGELSYCVDEDVSLRL
jgi:hypothetical protein